MLLALKCDRDSQHVHVLLTCETRVFLVKADQTKTAHPVQGFFILTHTHVITIATVCYRVRNEDLIEVRGVCECVLDGD